MSSTSDSEKHERDSTTKPPKIDSNSVTALGEYKVGKPYQVDGIWYYPKVNPDYDEVGIASWYGEAFHGKTTANGAVYNMNALTAAHKTLPMPSKVRVTNLSNGRSIILDVNDRGPFVHGRIIDLSRRASQLLGFKEKGLAMVRVRAISENGSLYVAEKYNNPTGEAEIVEAVPSVNVAVGDLPLPEGAVASAPIEIKNIVSRNTNKNIASINSNNLAIEKVSEFFVQVGSFLQEQNASRLSGKLSYFAPVRITTTEFDQNIYYRVQLGPVANVDEADNLMQNLIKSGYRDVHLIQDQSM